MKEELGGQSALSTVPFVQCIFGIQLGCNCACLPLLCGLIVLVHLLYDGVACGDNISSICLITGVYFRAGELATTHVITGRYLLNIAWLMVDI